MNLNILKQVSYQQDNRTSNADQKCMDLCVCVCAYRLKPFTSYKFRMLATNDVGDSVFSKETEAVTTLQDGERKETLTEPEKEKEKDNKICGSDVLTVLLNYIIKEECNRRLSVCIPFSLTLFLFVFCQCLMSLQ